MARKTKKEIEVKVLYDPKEKITDYTKELIDLRIGKDKIKIVEVERATVKPLDITTGLPCKISTSDVTILIREKDSNSEWIPTTLAIELKRGLDAFSSLYSNKQRLFDEISRCKEYGHRLYFISENSMSDTIAQIQKVPRLKNTGAENSHLDQMIELNRFLTSNGFDSVITCGKSMAWSIRRVIKHFIKENKLQYL